MPSKTNNPGADLEWSGVITLLLQYWVSYVQVWISRGYETFQGLHSYVGTTRNQPGHSQSTCITYENTDHFTLHSITCLPSPPPVALISFEPEGGHLCLKFDIILVKKKKKKKNQKKKKKNTYLWLFLGPGDVHAYIV